MTTDERNVVYRIEDGMDRRDVYCTTYQMRNFYRQMADGFFSSLDVFNYVQHHQIARWANRPRARVLDVCCGRGLLLPLLRYHAPKVALYCGVDIRPENAVWQTKRVTDSKPLADLIEDPADYYKFDTAFVEASVAEMTDPVREACGPDPFDLIVYTSAIEHMHHDVGLASLERCRELARDGSVMILTCPRTPEDQDGYDTRYRAHVYEWKRSELHAGLADTGWVVEDEWGLDIDKKSLMAAAEKNGLGPLVERLSAFLPNEWLKATLAPLFPEESAEIAMICRAS